MPLRLNVGVSRKLGLPGYCSAGASCNIEVELDSSLLQSDLDGFHARVRGAFGAARQAVHDELARLQSPPAPPVAAPFHGHDRRNGSGPHVDGSASRTDCDRDRLHKPATPSQVKAIHAIVQKRRADLEGLLRDDYGVERPEDLSASEAGALIDLLQTAAEV